MRRRRTAAALLAACLTAALTGCAGTDEPPAPEELGAAEPGDSPETDTEPAGRVVQLEPQATRGDAILVFGADPLRKAGSYALPGTPYGVAHDDAAQVLWVTLTARNEVVGLSTAGEQLTEVARFPTVRQPNTVAVDPDSGRVFVASRATGELQLIDP